MPKFTSSVSNPAWQIDQFMIRALNGTNTVAPSGTFRMLVNNIPLIFNSSPNLPYNID